MVRDPDGFIYLRERDGCLLVGGFEPVAKPVYEEESEFFKLSIYTNSNQKAMDLYLFFFLYYAIFPKDRVFFSQKIVYFF